MKITSLASLGFLALASAPLDAQTPAAPVAQTDMSRPCAPHAGMRFICEQKNAEDMEFLPGTPWIITTGMNNRRLRGNGFGILDSRTGRWRAGYPHEGTIRQAFDKARYAACAGAPDPARLGPHGLSIRREAVGHFTLYATNHGERESVEIFNVSVTGGAPPAMTWIGCVPLSSDGAIWNAVTASPDGGFYVTRMFKPGADRMDRYLLGKKDGAVFSWRPGQGLEEVPNTQFAGNNGITLSPDGRWLFVNERMTAEVVKLDMHARPPVETGRIKLNFLPDNVKWTGDGTITATGHHAGEDAMSQGNAAPVPSVPIAWSVARIDPVTMTLVKRMDVWGNRYFGGGTTGLQVGDEIWASSFKADRIARVPIRWKRPD